MGTTRSAAKIHVFDGSVEVRVVQNATRNADIIHEFTRDFVLRRVKASDTYWTWHRELEESGTIRHSASSCPEHAGVKAKLWERGRGWSEIRIGGDALPPAPAR